MSDRSVWEVILEEIVKLLEPLGAPPSSELRIRMFLEDINWNPESMPGLMAILSAATEMMALVDAPPKIPESLGDLPPFLQTIGDVFDKIRRISNLASAGTLPPELAPLGADIFEHLITRYLQAHRPLGWQSLSLLGLADAGRDAPLVDPIIVGDVVVRKSGVRPRLALDRIGPLLSNPGNFLRNRYLPNGLVDAAAADEAAASLFPPLALLVEALGGSAIAGYDPVADLALDADATALAKRMLSLRFTTLDGAEASAWLGLTVFLDSPDRTGLGVVLTPVGDLKLAETFGLWKLGIELDAAVDAIAIGPNGVTVLATNSNATSVGLSVSLKRTGEENAPALLVGGNTGTRFQVGGVGLTGSASFGGATKKWGFEVNLESISLVLAAGDGDGFLKKILPPDGIRADFSATIGWQSGRGIYFNGGPPSGDGQPIAKEIPLGIDIGGGALKIPTAYLEIRPSAERINLNLTVTAELHLGPLDGIAERLGMALTATPKADGNLGPIDLGIRFKPPTGVGLALRTGPVRGGGYLFIDPEAGQYAGVLQLEFSAIALKAIGILTTKMPDGSEGFSLLIIITAEFTPIQLGFGFTLSGVGGLIGINRTMLIEPLRDGIKQHTLDSILFPKDPVANVTRIIGDLKTVFPPVEARFTFGLMAKLGWGSPAVLTAEIGIIIELMAPVRLAILGKIQLVLPEDNKDAIVKLRLDVLGTLDFAKCELGIDAVLYDSRIAIFDISGGMALRVSWGASPAFALSVGGFNPRFAAPPGFPILDRLAISLATGNNPRIRLESYLAVTSNTVQIGAKFEVFAEAKFLGTWTVNAYLGFDALIYLSPFHFIVDVYGGASLKHNGNPLLSLDLFLSVSGPGQWIVHGRAVFDFFGKHSIAVDCTIGEPDPPPPLPIANPLEDLKVAIEDPRSWSAQLPDIGQMLVTLREIDASDMVLVHPLGQLTVRERVVPLEIEITHYGASDPGTHRRFAIDSVKLGSELVSAGSQIREKFAPGQFFELTEDQKLSGPEFEPLPAGLTGIGSIAITSGAAVATTFDYETIVIDVIQPAPLPGLKYTARDEVVLVLAKTSAAGQAPARRDGAGGFRGPAKGIKVHEPSYRIAGKRNLSTAAGTAEYSSRTEAAATLQTRADSGDLQIVGTYEEAA